MSAFTGANFPNMPQVSGLSVSAMTELANAYNAAKAAFETHANAQIGPDSDPHGIQKYIDNQIKTASETSTKAKNKVDLLVKFLVGNQADFGFNAKLLDFMKNNLDNKNVVEFVSGLVERIVALEEQLHTLSLLQFDNVPVGAGIRWWKDTLPEDGTYVWANGQTLYGVNQNFPELARVWEVGSADNIKVPKEDHTIFKVRKATVEIKPIEHAYIAAASGSNTPGNGD